MSANNAKVQAVIETTFNSAINKLAANEAGNCYSDLYVQVDAESGELLIYDSGYPFRRVEREGWDENLAGR